MDANKKPTENELEMVSPHDDPSFKELPEDSDLAIEDDDDDLDEEDLDEEDSEEEELDDDDLLGGDPAIEKGPQVEDLPDSESEELHGPRI